MKTASSFRLLFTVLAAAMLCFAPVLAQKNAAPIVIERILINVDGAPADASMTALVTIRKGESYSLKKIRDNIRQIYKTELFSNVVVERSGDSAVELTFQLTRRQLIRDIIFRGNLGVPQERLKESLLSLRPGTPFAEDKLQRSEEELKSALQAEGYFKSEIKASARRQPGSPAADIVFDVNPGKRLIIDRIVFTGEIVIDEIRLRKSIKSREGEIYIPSRLQQDISRIKDMFRGIGFERAEIVVEGEVFHPGEERVSLSLKIKPHEKITIVVSGAAIPNNLLKPIWEERIFEEWGLAEGEARILSYLREKGYLFASVDSSLEKTERELRILYRISAGEKMRIQEVDFEGIALFTRNRLKEILRVTKPILFIGTIDGRRIFEIPRDIQNIYRSQGFPDTQVSVNFIRLDAHRIRAVFNIQEGVQRRIKAVRFRGANMFPEEKLKAVLTEIEGGPWLQSNLQRDIEYIETFYLNQGVRGTRVTARVDNEEDNFFSMTFDIAEGRRMTIGKIVVAGQLATRMSTIRKEITIREGEPAQRNAILETKSNLERLGIFSEVKVEEIPVSEETENVVFNLREGERNYASVGVGWETKTEPRSFEIWNNIIRLRGTAEVSRSNMFGTAAQLSFVSQLSIKETRGVLTWEQPYFFSVPMRTYVNAWLEREERKSFGFDQRGLSLAGIKQLNESDVLIGTLRFVRTVLTFLEITESEIDRQYFPFSAASVSMSYIRDRRNDAFNPERGYFFSGVVEWAYPLFKAESNFLKTFFKYQCFVPLYTHLNFNLTARLGLGRGRIPIHERFFGGGANSFRGERIDELGPRDPASGKPVGGKALALVNFELRFPLISTLRYLTGAAFYDVGNVFSKRSNFDLLEFKNAVGAGLRYRTPLGALRFDLAWNLSASEHKGKPFVFITIGNMF